MTIVPAVFPAQVATVRELFAEYARSLGVDLSFQGFESELAQLPGDYAAPDGTLLLAEEGGQAAGCVGLRREAPRTGEMKRLYVRPAHRGGGLGRALVVELIEEARRRGYERLRLDTLPSMGAAIRLYRELGFRPIAPYRFNPVEGADFLELSLGAPPVEGGR